MMLAYNDAIISMVCYADRKSKFRMLCGSI